MASRFLGKTALEGLAPLRLDGQPVLDQYQRLRALLSARLDPSAADLFAEPMVTWTGSGGAAGSVAWYADVETDPVPLAQLPPDRRAAAEQFLRRQIGRLETLVRDPELGPLLNRVVVVAGGDGIRVAGERVVVIGWGLAPAGATGDLHQISALFPYFPVAPAPSAPPPSAPGTEPPPQAGAVPPASAYPPPPAAPPPAAPPPRPVPAGPRPAAAAPIGAGTGVAGHAAAEPVAVRSVWNWWLVPLGVAVGTLFLALGLWVGARLVADRLAARPPSVALFDEGAVRQAIEQQRARNQALEREIEDRRHSLADNACIADPAQLPRLGLGPDPNATVPPAATPPAPQGQPTYQGTMATLVKQATVLVIAKKERGLSAGTGFFVTPDTLVTNRHVIEGADPAQIFVTNETFGRLTSAHLLGETPNSDIGKPDFALLKVDNPPAIQPLALTPTLAQLDPVDAAGYPALAMQADEAFGRLLHNDPTAIPQLILTDGRVNAIQPASSGFKLVLHSAAVSPGNSGGPLVDACGRVVGVNTFIAADTESAAHVNYAQKTDTVLDFLKANNIDVSVLTDACVPGAPIAPGSARPPSAGGPPTSPPASPPTSPATPPPAPGPNTAPPPASGPATAPPATPRPGTAPPPSSPPAARPNGPSSGAILPPASVSPPTPIPGARPPG